MTTKPSLIDMSGVTFMDSSCPAALIRLANARGVLLVAVSQVALSMLRRTGTLDLFEVVYHAIRNGWTITPPEHLEALVECGLDTAVGCGVALDLGGAYVRTEVGHMTDAAEFTVLVAPDVDGTVVHVRGEIDIATCEQLRDAIEPHLGPGQRVVLDLSEVTFMDSSCMTVLVRARTTLTADGGSLVLRNPSGAARRVLSLAGLTELLA